MKEKIPAEAFPPGEFLREELEARNWTQNDFAEILGRSPQNVNSIISGKQGITPETATALADALGTSAQYWLNLESIYQLYRLSQSNKRDDNVSRRSRLYSKAPITHMVKRGWIEHSSNLTVLENQVFDFLEMESINEEPDFGQHAARKSTAYHEVTNAQTAWLFRAKHLAKSVSGNSFSQAQLRKAIENLRLLLHEPEEIRHVPRILAEAGIRFLVVEALPHTLIDGACFWLDAKSPVVALSMRYDRIDYFWHTLMHDLGHVSAKDGLSNDSPTIDTNIEGNKAVPTEEKPAFEKAADRFAVETLVPQDALEDFIVRLQPLIPKPRIQAFAALNHIHPGIVTGQLQHRGDISYSMNRDSLVKVRDIITQAALTDGWGNVVPMAL